jgi:hypothetical protein
MTRSAVELPLREGQLLAVPARHYSLPFAMAVNAVCSDAATRPAAIAVELGPTAAAAVQAWMRELGVGPDTYCRLPSLLGLVRENRMIHPALREEALRLLRETGKELHELSPETLARELDFRGLSVLPLAAADSMMEAIRCGLELNIPVYGLDLEEFAGVQRDRVILEDPWSETGNLAEFILRNASRAARQGDTTIDPRRERAMAARLKAVLLRHGRVLFSGGLGHWRNLAQLLQAADPRPASSGLEPAAPEPDHLWQRTVIHPTIAVQQLDAFPALVEEWERGRPHAVLGPRLHDAPARHPRTLLALLLYRVYARHFLLDPRDEIRELDWVNRAHFEQLVAGETRFGLLSFPDFELLLKCARTTMSQAFVDTLSREFMRHPWANPGAGDSRLEPEREGQGSEASVTVSGPGRSPERRLAQWQPSQEDITPDRQLFYDWETGTQEKEWDNSHHTRHAGCFTWQPWEKLATSLSARAGQEASHKHRIRVVEPFAGQILDGIEPRRTLRAHSAGLEEIHVRSTRLARAGLPETDLDAFPVVWLFDADPDPGSAQPHYYITQIPLLLEAARDRRALRKLVKGTGHNMVDIVSLVDRAEYSSLPGSSRAIIHDTSRGWIMYRPQCPSLRREGEWMLRTGCTTLPDNASHEEASGRPDLAGFFRPGRNHNAPPWQDALIRMALDGARRHVTVVAPNSYRPQHSTYELAQRMGKHIALMPLDRFPQEHVDRIRAIHLVPGNITGPMGRIRYEGHPEAVFNESTERYRERVPNHWRSYLLSPAR